VRFSDSCLTRRETERHSSSKCRASSSNRDSVSYPSSTRHFSVQLALLHRIYCVCSLIPKPDDSELIFVGCSAAWTTFGTFQIESTWSWRIPSALQALSSIVQVFLIYFCPESPRWLYSKGKDDEALQTLAYYHADGNRYVNM